MSAKECVDTFCSLVSRSGNLVLDIGPSADGMIPVIMEERLCQTGDWLRVNGEAIYDTEVYCPAPKDDVYFTKKDGRIYAILKKYPFGSVRLGDVPYSQHRSARLLALDAPAEIGIREEDGGTVLDFPPIDPDRMRSEWLYAVEQTEPE